MTFPAYPEYKVSGVEWLGEVPAHWETRKMAHAFTKIGSGTTPPSNEQKWYENGTIPWVTTSELRERLITKTKKHITNEALTKYTSLQVHPPGSLAIAMYGATIGRLGTLGVSATTNQACCVLSGSRTLQTAFTLYWLLVFKDVIISLYATGGGQPNINQETIANLRIPAPSLTDQSEIAAFLDHETARIDALVEEQQRLIELLKEKRQAVISHAVTKGLDPDVPMKDSGVEWLGEVPTHWDTKRVKSICALGNESLRPGPFGSHIKGDDFVEESDFRVYNQATVISNDFRTSAFIEKSKYEELAAFSVSAEDVLITSRGTIGRVAVAPKDVKKGIIHPCLIRLRLDSKKIDRRYFCLFFGSTDIAIEQLRLLSNSTTIDVVYADSLANTWVSLPSLKEQVDILDYLRPLMNLIDSTIETASEQKRLLKERRSALISAAVTGKIDVRGWQADQEFEPPDMLMAAEDQASYKSKAPQ